MRSGRTLMSSAGPYKYWRLSIVEYNAKFLSRLWTKAALTVNVKERCFAMMKMTTLLFRVQIKCKDRSDSSAVVEATVLIEGYSEILSSKLGVVQQTYRSFKYLPQPKNKD